MLKRFPARNEIVPVYAVIAFFIQSWTIYKLFWQLPSLLNYLDLGVITGLFSYRIAVSFIESLIVLACLLLLCLVLPAGWLKDMFVARGTVGILVLLGLIALFWNLFHAREPGLAMVDFAWIWLIGAFSLSWVIAYFLTKIKKLPGFVFGIADRMIVFLYILLPISGVSLFVVLIRNIN